MTEVILFVLLAAGLLANVAWTLFLLRKNKLVRTSSPVDLVDLEGRVERLLSEIHRVTSANVELLEGRIDALREVGGLADERLRRIRSSLTDLEVLLNRVGRVKNSLIPASSANQSSESTSQTEIQGPLDSEEKRESEPRVAQRTRSETVCGLYREGLTERQIAQKTGLGIAEIRFLLKLSNVGGTERAKIESR